VAKVLRGEPDIVVVLDPAEAEILKESLVEWSVEIDHTSSGDQVKRAIRLDDGRGGSVTIQISDR
jgi:hypothetical protein